jgi:hypothetical protein
LEALMGSSQRFGKAADYFIASHLTLLNKLLRFKQNVCEVKADPI